MSRYLSQKQWSINSQSLYLLFLHRVNRSCTYEWNIHVKGPLLVNYECVLYIWTGHSTDIGHSMCEQDYSLWQCLKACNTMPFHIPWHTSPGHTRYHAMSARPYLIPCDTRQAIAYTMPWPPDHTIYHSLPAKPYHIPGLQKFWNPNRWRHRNMRPTIPNSHEN